MSQLKQFVPGNRSNIKKCLVKLYLKNKNNGYNINDNDNFNLNWLCNNNSYNKFKFSSVAPNPNISYKQQISQKIKSTVGGNVHYGNYYLGNTPNINYLGRTEGQPGGSGAPLRNKF